MSRPTQVSMQDIAKAAGVSPQTVSRVANGSDAVKPATRQRVEAAMERLGYRPNYAARALKHGRFQDIGVVMFNTATFGNARILDSIVANAADDDYSVTIQTMCWRNASPISSDTSLRENFQSCSSANPPPTTAPPLTPTSMAARPLSSIT